MRGQGEREGLIVSGDTGRQACLEKGVPGKKERAPQSGAGFMPESPNRIYTVYLTLSEAIRDHLACTCSTTDAKQRLTAKRIHTMILNGELDEKLPPMEVSIRTVERMVKDLRTELKIQTRKRHLSLLHAPGDAQLDFGEVDVFIDGKTCRQYILVLTFPYSNYHLAQMLPAQNFECLAEGLVTMFEFIGRVPNRIRCDNMSTAVAKILHRSDIVEEHDV